MHSKDKLLMASPQEFVTFLKSEHIKKFFFVYNEPSKKLNSSHAQLQPIADFIAADKRDFSEHEGLFFQVTEKYDTLQGAFVHRTNRGQAAGGVRYWQYDRLEDFLRDGLRLAKGMSQKNALAGLWWGGGKGVMAHNAAYEKNDPKIRKYLYSEYGAFISSLQGCYVTAEDVGTSVSDMAQVFSQTRFTTCIPQQVGGSGNPSVPTARGVICGMEAGLHFLGAGDLCGKIIAVQGVGNVGEPLIGFLLGKKVSKIFACDINPKLVEKVKQKYAGKNLEVKAVSPEDTWIFQVEADIFSPNATGAIISPRTITQLKAKIICGAANNQLEDASCDDKSLQKRGIFYIPDFLTNRMGIVNAANEQYGYVKNDPLFERHLDKNWEHSIYRTALKVLDQSRQTGETTCQVATRIADELSLQNHPIFGHRGQQIINSLVENRWHER